MEERRFDAWTRTLGAAASRRQVLKGVLGGVLAAVVGRAVVPSPAGAASQPCRGGRACQRQAEERSASCFNDCVQSLNSCMDGGGIASVPCFLTWHQCSGNCQDNLRSDQRACRHGGCLADATCCNGACVDIESGDPNNCGACGHVCPDGAQCIDSRCICNSGETVCNNLCVDLETNDFNCGACGNACDPDKTCSGGECSCDELQTRCGDTCVDTHNDNNNCGACGNACGNCEQCVAGICQALNCDSDRFCCQHACYPKCENNQPDPQTCQCGFCDSLENGTTCGPTSVCCQHDCVDTSCPNGRQFNDSTCQCDCTPVDCGMGKTQDPTTCQCVCSPITCPQGQAQDPNTCHCVDMCSQITCDTCQTCDSETGNCLPAPIGTSCGGDNICCEGACVAGPTCPNFCADQPLGAPCGTAHYCCGADQQCVNPLDTIGVDNHCCLQGTFWSDEDYACVSASDWCNAIGKGEPCGSEIDGYSMPICCDVGYTCESGACVPE